MYLYVKYILCHAQICTNDYFDFNYFYAKGNNFVVYLIFREDNK